MYFIYLFLTIGLLLLNLAGVTAWVSRYLPATASARVLGIFGLVLGFFFLEHFIGLGKLVWLWPISTLWSVWQISTRKDLDFWMGEGVFVLGFCYGLVWRFAFPNIDGGSEHLADLYFISNYQSGATLPPPDRWWADGVFDFYYALQHYAAALLSRWFNTEIGLAMNLALALIMGMLVSLDWEISRYFVKSTALRVLLVVALVAGGNGISPLMPWMIKDKQPATTENADAIVTRVWASTRFMGMYEQQVNAPLGRMIAGNPSEPSFAGHLELPMETIAYYSVLGDYHPPLGGFIIALWTLALTAFLGLRTKPKADVTIAYKNPDNWAFFALGLTPALVLVTNAWVLPLQGFLLITWLGFRQWHAKINWPALLIGGITGFGLIYPFLGYFSNNTIATSLQWVTEAEHTPLRFFLAIHWPMLLWLGAGLLIARHSPQAAWLTLVCAVILGLSEFILIDDPLVGKYQRFNTTLKWWSWLWPVALIGLGSVCIGAGKYSIRLLMIISLSALLMYTLDLGRYWQTVTKPQFGQLAGDGWLKQDPTQRELLNYLQNAPKGLVMESVEQGAYSSASALALFANQPLVLGWPDHLTQWHGQIPVITNRIANVRAFYRGELQDPLEFLSQLPVRYILWTATDELRKPNIRQILQSQLNRDYHWRAFNQMGIGLWERRATNIEQQH